MRFTELVIASPGSDFCKFCVKHTNLLGQHSDEFLDEVQHYLEIHRMHAAQEYLYYNRIRKRQNSCPRNVTLHLILYFAEKIVPPSMKRQPGNLHFVTALNLDIFGIPNLNSNTFNVYSLP